MNKEEAIAYGKRVIDLGLNDETQAFCELAIKALEEQTKMEGEKVGCWEWVQYESKPNFGNWHCSECRCILRGEIKENPIRLPKYCPECGARMEAKE